MSFSRPPSVLPGAVARILLCCLIFLAPLPAQDSFEAHVALVVDTSASMSTAGMDPERSSLLVAKLFSDIVPGKLAVIRLMTISIDQGVLGAAASSRVAPCPDDPARNCTIVDIPEESTRKMQSGELRIGEVIRPRRGDAAFKAQLDSHLIQQSTQSLFGPAFATSGAILAENRSSAADAPQTVIWLSDGMAEDWDNARRQLDKLRGEGVAVEAIIFGRGKIEQAQEAGLTPRRAAGPAQLMAAFADAFRRVVEAPYRVDGRIREQPTFEMKPGIDEAWVVIYGDTTLQSASVAGPGGEKPADFASDMHAPAGAYRVVYMNRPKEGRWEVKAVGGGPEVSYAVIQRSSLGPVIVEPSEATAGAPFTLIVALRSADLATNVPARELGEDVEMTAEIEGKTYTLRDDGAAPDTAANDGLYAGAVTINSPGAIPVTARAHNSFIDRSHEKTIEVTGLFMYSGGPVALNFGSFRSGETRCIDLSLTAEHVGSVPFELRELRPAPSGHVFELRSGDRVWRAGSDPLLLGPEAPKQICLATARNAPSSTGGGESWIELRVRGRESDPRAGAPLSLDWQVEELSFWELYKWWILGILGLLLLAFIVYGYIKPYRFPRELALIFVPEREDIEDETPLPVAAWKGTGIGWYRNARAYLHPNFRVTGKKKGAVAVLEAVGPRTVAAKGSGALVYFDTGDGDWDVVPEIGKRARSGDVFRVGDQGPFFQIASRVGR